MCFFCFLEANPNIPYKPKGCSPLKKNSTKTVEPLETTPNPTRKSSPENPEQKVLLQVPLTHRKRSTLQKPPQCSSASRVYLDIPSRSPPSAACCAAPATARCFWTTPCASTGNPTPGTAWKRRRSKGGGRVLGAGKGRGKQGF